MYNKTIIRFGFCDIQNNQGLDKGYQPKPSASADNPEWSPISSVIIRVITKSDDHAAGVRFVSHEYDYRPNRTTRSLITN